MPRVTLPEGASVHCAVDDFLWPWDTSTPVLMMQGFARNALFWNRWVHGDRRNPPRLSPGLLGLRPLRPAAGGLSLYPRDIGAQIMAVLDILALPRVHWVGESSGGIIGLLLTAAHPERIASLVLCNTPTRIPEQIKRTYALDRATASDAMRAYRRGRMVPADASLSARHGTRE
jgi:3-oxoadipate enol-lactonase